ncbi:MAG: TonB-dependent receptor, partial [Mangrovibacterium sp.]
MKLTVVILVIALAHVSANVYSQQTKLSLSFENVTLRDVLNKIEDESNYFFLYKNENIDVSDRVSIQMEDRSIEDILYHLFHESDIAFEIINRQIVLTSKAKENYGFIQQHMAVHGTVKSPQGEPVPGVTVMIKGTTIGTITNPEGYYSITNIPGNAVLVFSFVGMKEQEIPANKEEINVTMQEETIGIEEVVAVGYGTVKKSDLTGAVSSVTTDQIKERPSINVMQSLSGQVAGVQIQQTQGSPGFAPTIKIRGTSTITAGTTPLYVIDGIPIEDADLSIVNPQDVASIEVLKDASSAAIYGSRGANGVVLVTTKSGKAGKTTVDVNYERGIQHVARQVDMMNSQEFIQYYIDAHNNAWVYAGGNAGDANDIRPSNYQIPPDFLEDPDQFETTDWQDVAFRSAATRDNVQVSVSGGNAKTTFLLSGGYLSQEGIVDRSEYERISLRSNIKHEISEKLELGVNLALSKVKDRIYGTEGKTDVVSLALQSDPIFPVYNENGNLGFRDPDSEWYRFVQYSLQLWHPYSLTREIDNRGKRFDVLASAFLEYRFLDHFSFKTSLSATIEDDRYSQYQNEGQKYGYSAWNNAEGEATTDYNENWISENTLSYVNSIGDHFINMLVGYSVQENSYEGTNLTATGFPNDMVHTLNAGTPSEGGTEASKWRMVSYIGRANYSYKNKYLFTATIRRDGCSRFGSDNKWGYFPSGSFAWKASEERFLQNTNWLSSLKFRLSYGVTGNNLIPNYGSIALLDQRQYAWGNDVQQGLYQSTISNPDLKWEKTGQFDFGINAGFFNNRIYLEADYYHSTTKDLLLDVPVPVLTGFTEQLTNIGKVRNQGFEFLLTTRNTVNEFKWNTNMNISLNRNKVKKLGENNAPIYVTNWGTTKTEVGEPIANYFGYIFDGVFMNQSEVEAYPHVASTTPGDPRVHDVNGDKKIDENDRTIIGNAQPDFTFGITNDFTFRNFDLSILLQGSYGNEIMNSQTRYSKFYNGNRNGYEDIVNYWKSEDNPGDGKHFKPSISYPGLQTQFSDYWVEDGSYLRIANIRLGYNFGPKILSRLSVSSLRLYVNVDNVYCFTDYLGYDPENSVFTDALNSGNDYGAHPLPRTFTF